MKPGRGGRTRKVKNVGKSKRAGRPRTRQTRASQRSQRKRLREYVESASTSACSTCTTASSPSRCSSASTVSDNKESRAKKSYYKTYRRIKTGLRKSIPAAIVLWAFHKMPTTAGLTSRRVINFLKRHYRVVDDPRKTGKSISSILRCAVEFGLIQKRGNRYFLATRGR